MYRQEFEAKPLFAVISRTQDRVDVCSSSEISSHKGPENMTTQLLLLYRVAQYRYRKLPTVKREHDPRYLSEDRVV